MAGFLMFPSPQRKLARSVHQILSCTPRTCRCEHSMSRGLDFFSQAIHCLGGIFDA